MKNDILVLLRKANFQQMRLILAFMRGLIK